jgi:hypothetical protein
MEPNTNKKPQTKRQLPNRLLKLLAQIAKKVSKMLNKSQNLRKPTKKTVVRTRIKRKRKRKLLSLTNLVLKSSVHLQLTCFITTSDVLYSEENIQVSSTSS